MKNLAKLQQNFCWHIFDRNKKEIANILPYSNQEALARLNIYRNNVFGNFVGVLEMIFPATKKFLGQKEFIKIAENYCVKNPSISGNLNSFGDNFPKFLKVEVADLARLELALHHCYYVAEVKDFDIKKFQKLAPEKLFDLRFELDPSCFLIESKFMIYNIWQDFIAEKRIKKTIIKKPQTLLVERARGDCEVRELNKVEFIFLKNLKENKTLYQTYQKMMRAEKNCDIGSILNKFISLRIITNTISIR